MDRDDERKPYVHQPPSRTDQHVVFEREYAEQKRLQRETEFLEMLRGSARFAAEVKTQCPDHEYELDTIAATAAKEMARNDVKFTNTNIDARKLADAVHDAVEGLRKEQERQAVARDERQATSLRAPAPDPRQQWPGRYAKLKALLAPITERDQDVARRQREESTQRQDAERAKGHEERPSPSRDEKQDFIEQTDRRREGEASKSNKEVTDSCFSKLESLLKNFESADREVTRQRDSGGRQR